MTTEDLASIHVDQFLSHPPSKVWRALTEPGLIAQWFMPGDFQLRVGHQYTMTTKPVPATKFSGVVNAEVLDFRINEMLSIRWRDAKPATVHASDWIVTWTLIPEGTGTRLMLEHSGFDPDDFIQQQSRKIMGMGWSSSIPRALERVLDSI